MLPKVEVAPPGPRSRALAARLSAVECPAFDARRDAREAASGEDQSPIVYARGEGSNVWDVDGNRYVDLTAGFGALALGYGPNAATRAATEAIATLPLALGDVYASELKVRACEAIAGAIREPGARVLLGTSGADAVTAALKTAALATGKPRVVAFEGSYHGLSHGPLAALGLAASFRDPFVAQLGAFVDFAPYPSNERELDASLSAVRAAVKRGDVGAILVEPILGRGGCVVPPRAFLPALRAIAGESGALLVADEIWTGMGRAGRSMCASSPTLPDVVCLGKALGAGFPISACVGRGHVMEAWGRHGGAAIHTGTHFGAPPACAAALAAIDAIAAIEDVEAKGKRCLDKFVAAGFEARGQGLMIGVVTKDAATALAMARRWLAKGFVALTGGRHGNVLTLTPPLTIEDAELDAAVEALA